MGNGRQPTSPAASPGQVRDVDVALDRGIEIPDFVREIPANGYDSRETVPDARDGSRRDPGRGTFAPGVVAEIAAGPAAVVDGERFARVDEADIDDAATQ